MQYKIKNQSEIQLNRQILEVKYSIIEINISEGFVDKIVCYLKSHLAV